MSDDRPLTDFENRRECRTCGNRVSTRFAAVFGDGDDTVYRCPECDTRGRLASGSAAGKAVAGVDPVDDPSRKRSVTARTDGGDET